MKPILAAIFLVGAMVGPAFAGTYRCSGKVQFRPCGYPVADGKVAFETVNLPKVKITKIPRSNEPLSGNARSAPRVWPAIVEVKSFERVGKRDGLWRGFVTGKGKVRLNLKFAKSGRVQEERAVGQVFLSRYKTTNFTVRTTLPRGGDLTWHIEAFQDIA